MTFRRYQWQVLAILTLINFVNYIDRSVIFPLFSPIKAEFLLSDFQLGLLGTVFTVVNSLATFPCGILADRLARTKVITYGILFWSGATFLSGLAPSFRGLLLSRSLVGVGESAYTPASASIISSVFPQQLRARMQGIFHMGMFAGGTVGLALGGIFAEWVGWRRAFFLVGVPGLLLAMLIFTLREPGREKVHEYVPVKLLLRVPAFVFVLVSGTLITFAGSSFVVWGTEFVVRYKGFSLRQAGFSLGALLLIAGILGVTAGGLVADQLQRRWAWGRVLTVALAFLVSAPLLFLALHAGDKRVFLAAFFGAGFFMSWYHGPVTAIIHDLVPPRAHGTALGLYMFVVHFLGEAFAPAVIGKIADVRSLLAGLQIATVASLAGALAFFLVLYFIVRDGLQHPALAHYQS